MNANLFVIYFYFIRYLYYFMTYLNAFWGTFKLKLKGTTLDTNSNADTQIFVQ